MNKRGKISTRFMLILGLVIAVAFIYFFFFFNYSCNSLACFQAHQKNCDHTKFVNDVQDATWQYKIIGNRGDSCRIEVTLLQVRKGDIALEKLQGESMKCDAPKGQIAPPESDLKSCHGILKEGLQEIIIQKMHSYIITNLGEISAELEGII